MTTDGDPSMIDKEAGCVNAFAIFFRHPLVSFQRVVHQEDLSVTASLKKFEKITKIVTIIVNYISENTLQIKIKFRFY